VQIDLVAMRTDTGKIDSADLFLIAAVVRRPNATFAQASAIWASGKAC
jgi:hypothetical protein